MQYQEITPEIVVKLFHGLKETDEFVIDLTEVFNECITQTEPKKERQTDGLSERVDFVIDDVKDEYFWNIVTNNVSRKHKELYACMQGYVSSIIYETLYDWYVWITKLNEATHVLNDLLGEKESGEK